MVRGHGHRRLRGGSDYDRDGDGQDAELGGGRDCDDGNADVYDGAPDDPYDGLVTDCASSGDYDGDGDGHASAEHGGADCDDSNAAVYPGAAEVWYDGTDADCDENDIDQDYDGVAVGDDCDDTDPAVTVCTALPDDTGCGRATGSSSSFPTGILVLGLALGARRRSR